MVIQAVLNFSEGPTGSLVRFLTTTIPSPPNPLLGLRANASGRFSQSKDITSKGLLNLAYISGTETPAFRKSFLVKIFDFAAFFPKGLLNGYEKSLARAFKPRSSDVFIYYFDINFLNLIYSITLSPEYLPRVISIANIEISQSSGLNKASS